MSEGRSGWRPPRAPAKPEAIAESVSYWERVRGTGGGDASPAPLPDPSTIETPDWWDGSTGNAHYSAEARDDE